MFILKTYEWCHWYPVLKCRELLNRGVLNCRDHCITYRSQLPSVTTGMADPEQVTSLAFLYSALAQRIQNNLHSITLLSSGHHCHRWSRIIYKPFFPLLTTSRLHSDQLTSSAFPLLSTGTADPEFLQFLDLVGGIIAHLFHLKQCW